MTGLRMRAGRTRGQSLGGTLLIPDFCLPLRTRSIYLKKYQRAAPFQAVNAVTIYFQSTPFGRPDMTGVVLFGVGGSSTTTTVFFE